MSPHQEFLILKIAYMLIVKLDLSLRPNLVFHYIPWKQDVNWTPRFYVHLIHNLCPEGLFKSD